MKQALICLLTCFTLTATAQKIHWFEVQDFDGDEAVVYTGERKYLKKYPAYGGPYTTDSTLVPDCNDSNATIFPGNIETCNGIDNDCDGVIDNGITKFKLYTDLDLNGWADDTSVYIYSCTATLPGYCDKVQILRPIETRLWTVGMVDIYFKQISPYVNRDILKDVSFITPFLSMGFRGLQAPWGASTSNEGEVISDTAIYSLPGNGYNCSNPNFSFGICKKTTGKDFNYEGLAVAKKYRIPIDFIVPIMSKTAKDQLTRVVNYIGEDLVNKICLGMETNVNIYGYSDAQYLTDATALISAFPSYGDKWSLDGTPADNPRRNNTIATIPGAYDARLYIEAVDFGPYSKGDWTANLKLLESGITVTMPQMLLGRLKAVPGKKIYIAQYSTGRLTELDGRMIAGLGYGLFHVAFNEFNNAHGDSISGASLQGLKAELITDRNALTLEGEACIVIGKFYAGSPYYVSSLSTSGLYVTSQLRDGVYSSLVVNISANTYVNPAIQVNGAVRSAASFSSIAGVSPDSKIYTIENGTGSFICRPYSVSFVQWGNMALLTGN